MGQHCDSCSEVVPPEWWEKDPACPWCGDPHKCGDGHYEDRDSGGPSLMDQYRETSEMKRWDNHPGWSK